jgi:hypothetical protein
MPVIGYISGRTVDSDEVSYTRSLHCGSVRG